MTIHQFLAAFSHEQLAKATFHDGQIQVRPPTTHTPWAWACRSVSPKWVGKCRDAARGCSFPHRARGGSSSTSGQTFYAWHLPRRGSSVEVTMDPRSTTQETTALTRLARTVAHCVPQRRFYRCACGIKRSSTTWSRTRSGLASGSTGTKARSPPSSRCTFPFTSWPSRPTAPWQWRLTVSSSASWQVLTCGIV